MSEPGRRAPAPPALRQVQRFINTNDFERGGEQLSSPSDLGDWLVEERLLDRRVEVTDQQLAHAIELREALRTLVAAHNDVLGDTAAAIAVVNEVAWSTQLRPLLSGDEHSLLEPTAPEIDAALGRIVALVHRAVADRTWLRLKACERDQCRWAFYDYSKNKSGRWCHSSVCGSRVRSRRAYERRRAAGSTDR
jgi:predicted RNA-binding Zn ribbon-like protein